MGAVEARALISRKKLSSEELVRACIARIDSVDHAINALVSRDFEGAIAAARQADIAVHRGDTLGALHGLPFGVKDMIDVRGLATTFGSELYCDNIATTDDRLITAMRDAGAIPIGKTNVPEWSAGGNTINRVFGATANPYDLTRTCSGSSGGSAASLAAGYFPLATGSDTGGSLRNPAAFCGVVGFRPSPGVVPGNTRPIGSLPLSSLGPMARSVRDVGLMLSVISRPDTRDPYNASVKDRMAWDPENFTAFPQADLSALKIAFTEDYGFAPTEGIVRNHFRKVVSQLSGQFHVLENRSPDCTNANRIFSVMRGLVFLGIHGKRVDNHPEQVGPNVVANVIEARSFTPDDIAQALTWQTEYQHRWQAFFETYDYVISPAVTVSPRKWTELYPKEIDGRATESYYHWLAMAYASTISGQPSITIPCGHDANGMPFGLQIVGKRYDDLGVLAVAHELEQIIKDISNLAPGKPDLEMLRAASPLAESEGFRSL